MRPFRRKGDELLARLDPAEARILALLLDQLEQLLTADAEDVAGDPVLDRLLPAGHRSDPELAADYRDLTESSLRTGKADDLATVRAGLPLDGGTVRLDPEEAGAWLRTSNDLRLALGTRLGVTEDEEYDADADDPRARALGVYHYLGVLQETLVDSVTRGDR